MAEKNQDSKNKKSYILENEKLLPLNEKFLTSWCTNKSKRNKKLNLKIQMNSLMKCTNQKEKENEMSSA